MRLRYFVYIITILSFTSFAFADPGILERILQKMQAFSRERAQQKIYLHFDKPIYAGGDTIWFKAYIVEASLHYLDSQSRVMYAELFDDTNTLISRQVFRSDGGVSFGHLALAPELRGGKYLMRAYTNYMKNAGENFFFRKEFTLLDPKETSAHVDAPAADSVDLQFLPEGGNMVACGIPNTIGFNVLASNGFGLDASGEIIDERNVVVCSFKTAHNGMGKVSFIPLAGKKYRGRITKPFLSKYHPLPDVQREGYLLQVTAVNNQFQVVVSSAAGGKASEIYLVVQSRGKVYHALQGSFVNHQFVTNVPCNKIPNGISHITAFNVLGQPVAERLIYHRTDEDLTLEISTDAPSYGKREMVTIDLEAIHHTGAAAKGNFSVSVFNEDLLLEEKYPITIGNYLHLTSDLAGNIENPGYYFKDNLPETKEHRDLLMLVHGWRRFTWNDVLSEQQSPLKFQHEKGLAISGRIQKQTGYDVPAESIIKIMSMKGDVVITTADANGRFYTDELRHVDSVSLLIQTENDKGKKKPYAFMLEPFNPSPPSNHHFTINSQPGGAKYLDAKREQLRQENQSNPSLEKAKELKAVEVTAKKIEDPLNRQRVLSGSNQVFYTKDMSPGYDNIFQMIQNRAPGLTIEGTPPTDAKIRGSAPAYLINGMPVTGEQVGLLQPRMVESISVIIGPGASVYGAHGVISIQLRAGAGDRDQIGINKVKYPGFTQQVEFYSPRYDVDSRKLKDLRTTLFWEPMMVTNKYGRSSISFYTGDVSGRYRIVVEGITPNGYAGTTSTTFEVE